MAANENIINIPGRLKNVANNGYVTGASDIFDDALNKDQETINAELNDGFIGIINSKGVNGGIATLGEDGKVLPSQLPSYVDTIVEGYYYDNNFYEDSSHTILINPSSGVIYNDIPTNISYRYSGTNYVAISSGAIPDEEDITSDDYKLKFKNKIYNSASFSGLGRIYLRKNIIDGYNVLTQAMLSYTNTVYIVQYDYTLAANITIPANCILKFEGGSISGAYTITGNNTKINAADTSIFSEVTIAGTWVCPRITSAWFSDASENNRIKQVFNLTSEDAFNDVVIESALYAVSASTEKEVIVSLKSNTKVVLIGSIKLSANNLEDCKIFSAVEKQNITITGNGTIEGDLEEHTGTTGEGGTGIDIEGSKDIVVRGINIENCWGDGIYIGGWHGKSSNIIIEGVTFNGFGRAAISLTIGENIVFQNLSITGANVNVETAGIDIEPNTDNVDIINVTLDNIIVKDSFSGINAVNHVVKNVKLSHLVVSGMSHTAININLPSDSDMITIYDCNLAGTSYINANNTVISNSTFSALALYTKGGYIHDCIIKSCVNLYTNKVINCELIASQNLNLNADLVYGNTITCSGNIAGGDNTLNVLRFNTITSKSIALSNSYVVENNIINTNGFPSNGLFDSSSGSNVYIVRNNVIKFGSTFGSRVFYARSTNKVVFTNNILVNPNYVELINSTYNEGWNICNNIEMANGAVTIPELAMKVSSGKPKFYINSTWVDATGSAS